jgi:predicted nucleotidyltransferase
MNIKEIISTINEMQTAGVIGQYAIGGAVAAIFYKVEPDTTFDIDVFIALNPLPGRSLVDPSPIFTYLQSRGYQLTKEGYVRIANWPVQFVPPPTLLVEEALQQAVEVDFDGVSVRVFTIEHLAAIAFEVGRPKDKLRLPRFLTSKGFDESRFSKILQRYGLLDRWINFRKQIFD